MRPIGNDARNPSSASATAACMKCLRIPGLTSDPKPSNSSSVPKPAGISAVGLCLSPPSCAQYQYVTNPSTQSSTPIVIVVLIIARTILPSRPLLFQCRDYGTCDLLLQLPPPARRGETG